MAETPGDIDALVRSMIEARAAGLEETARQIAERVAALDANLGHLSARIAKLDERIASVEGGAGGGAGTGGGGGKPILLARIPDERLIFQIDPHDPRTYGPDRRFGQAWAAGNMFQIGDRNDFVGPQLPPEHRLGYGLQMTADGQVESWPMEDGTTTRYGVIVVDGARYFRLACQARPHLDDYDPSGMAWFNRGVGVEPGQGWRVDTRIRREPGRSDARTFDAPRSELSGAGANVRTGRGAPVTIWGIAYRGAPWMKTTASIAGPFDLHAAGWSTTGQMVGSLTNGKLVFWSKSSPSAEQITWGRTTNHDLTNVALHEIDAPEPGEVHQIIVASRPDRIGDTSVFRMWMGDGKGAMDEIYSTTRPYGYEWDQASKNGENYPKTQIYPWSEWNTPASGRFPIWNHDQRFGNVYDLQLGAFAVTSDEMLDASVEDAAAKMAEHVAAVAS